MKDGDLRHLQFFTVRQVASALQVGPRTIYRMIADGRLPATKIGNRYRILGEDVLGLSDSTVRSPE